MINNDNYSNNASTVQLSNCTGEHNSNNQKQNNQHNTQPQSHLHSNNRPPLPSFLSIKDQFKTMLLDIMSLADLMLDDIRKEIDEYNVDKNKYIFISNAFDTKAEAFMKSKRKSDVYRGDITENLNVNDNNNNSQEQSDDNDIDLSDNKFLNDNFNKSYYKRTDEDLKDDDNDYSKNKNKPPKPTPQQILDNSYNELYNIHKQQQLNSQINNNNTIPERMPTHKELIYAEKKAEYIRKENVTSINTFMVSRKNSIVFRLNGISKIVKRISPLLNKYCHEEMKEMRMVREMMVEAKSENNTITNNITNKTITNINNNTTNNTTTNTDINKNSEVVANENNTDINKNSEVIANENNADISKVSENENNTDISKYGEVIANENNTDISKVSKNNNTTINTTTNTNWNILYQIYLQCMTNKSHNLLFTIQTTDFRKNNFTTTSPP
ncbi:MAG: hypothetical protein Ta2D_10460 [Rickettsiales bacterium]|nr:MAG: hypothetical protein Ta2D_10460 [Rickettsiales bacterium]